MMDKISECDACGQLLSAHRLVSKEELHRIENNTNLLYIRCYYIMGKSKKFLNNLIFFLGDKRYLDKKHEYPCDEEFMRDIST